MLRVHRTLLLRLLLSAPLTLAAGASAFGADWRPPDAATAPPGGAGLSYAERTAERPADGLQVTAHLALFDSPAYRLNVIDLGAGPEPAFRSLAEAFRAHHAVAGTNGGFFHPDWGPLGLVIASGRRMHRFERSKLLSGVLYSDGEGTHLVRRARFRDHPGISALLQSGPYLVEHGRAVRGLSDASARRRTFIATDWGGHWALGATTTRLTLAELAEALAAPGALTPWPVDRALNLDGGTSTGFFFDRGPDAPPVLLEPARRVRTLLGITRRDGAARSTAAARTPRDR